MTAVLAGVAIASPAVADASPAAPRSVPASPAAILKVEGELVSGIFRIVGADEEIEAPVPVPVEDCDAGVRPQRAEV